MRSVLILLLSLSMAHATAAAEPQIAIAAPSGIWETSIAISSVDPKVAVAIGVVGGGGSVQPFYTEDGGLTWQESAALGLTTPTRTYARHGDPVVAAGPDGLLYATTLIGYPRSYPLTYGGIAVYRSDDGGKTWSDPLPVVERAPEDNPRFRDDKEWIGVDTTTGPHRGNVYVSWLRDDVNNPQRVEAVFSRSTDQGRTWSPELILGGGSGGQISIGPNSEVHLLRVCPGGYNCSQTSTDGGVTFGAPVRIGPSGTFLSNAADSSAGPHGGNVYIAWIGSITGPQLSRSYAGTVYFARSTDGAATWQPPVAITPVGTGTGLFQTIACDPVTGDLVIAWLDRRANRQGKTFTLYMTRSTDGGATWSPHQAVSEPVDMTNLSPGGFIGDYNQTAAQGGVFLSSFSDGAGRMGVLRLQFDPPPPRVRRRSVRP